MVCIYVYVSMCVCEITPVNTEKGEGPVPSTREAVASGAPGQRLHPWAPPEHFTRPTLPSSSNTQ